MAGVGTSIFERPRPLPRQRRADGYTVNCDEPRKAPVGTARTRRVAVHTRHDPAVHSCRSSRNFQKYHVHRRRQRPRRRRPGHEASKVRFSRNFATDGTEEQ
jgi:hypothetical protein